MNNLLQLKSNIKIGIASHKYYKSKTIPILLQSLIECGINQSDITIFISGYNSFNQYTENEINYRELNFNSFELSPMIDIVENKLIAEYWFLLHDTCKVGKEFKNKLYNIPKSKPEKIALKRFPSMNIGLYSYDYLLTYAEKILKMKNIDYSYSSIQSCKTWHINNEDYLLWRNGGEPLIYHNGGPNIVGIENWYGADTTRIIEYYSGLDLYKNKANWQLSNTYVVNI